MFGRMRDDLTTTIGEIRDAGLYKSERVISSPQNAAISVASGTEVLNFCANNYLGLADHPEVLKAAKDALDRWGFGMASVRFICGTQQIHKDLEGALSNFLGTEDTILYSSCFDANGGLFETWYSMTVLLQRGLDLAPVITHRYDHTQHAEAFATAREGKCGKVILDWTGA